MVKFCLLTTFLLCSTSVYELITQHITLKDESDKVFNVLEQFLTPKKPLNIGYLGPENETLSTKTTIVTKAVKQVLKKVNPIFTDECLSKISLGKTNMMPGKSVKVPFFYHLEKYEDSYVEMDIYIKEHLSELRESVTAIANKIKLELHLKNFCYQKMMDTPAVAQDIRQGLVGQKVLSATEAQYVRPENQMLISNHKYKLRVVKDGKTAYSQPNLFIINRYSKIIHWECNDNVLHFIAYFTPGDYIVLRKVLSAMPENYFLGALIQILNDGEFDGGDPYCVPRVSDIKEYTHAYRHIFRWDNRLETYMGHFGAWYDKKWSTADSMVRLEKCDSMRCSYNKICNGASVLRDWLKKWLKNHGEHQNNNGVMMNLKWEFTREFAFTQYSFAYWDSSLW